MTKMWWAQGFAGMALLFLWLCFLIVGAKSKVDYFFDNAEILVPGKEVLTEGNNKNLYLEGFSGKEPGGRWSVGYQQLICAKLSALPDGVRRSEKVVLNVNLVDDLIDEKIHLKANGESRDYYCNKKDCEMVVDLSDFSIDDENICLSITIPYTVNVPGDPRKLGFFLRDIQFLDRP